MPLKIYLSATFADLEQHREKVYRELRALRHDVIAMEDDVAADKRPLQQCLQDVGSCDIYVAIFAWRYGYVPTEDNPQKKSITELEMREAERLEKPRLIFLLKDDAPWRPTMSDMGTGDNERGARIKALREELKQDRLAGMFETPEELAVRVVTAVSRWQMESSMTKPGTEEPAAPRDGARASARRDYKKLWVPGSQLRVRFLNGPSILRRRVLRLAQIWSAYANVSFEASDTTGSELRVSLGDDGGNWSYIGTDCLAVGQEDPTVNLGWVREDSPLDELEAAVVHEFGHALGLFHEHNNPDANISWNKEKAYEQMGGPPVHWSKEAVDTYLFTTWPREIYPFAKPFDPHSIMANVIPLELTNDGLSIGRNVSVSPGDKEFISRLYPYADAAKSEAKPRMRKRGRG